MGLFCYSTCQCQRKCKGWFGAMPDTERQCKNACKTNGFLTKDEFLCSGNWINQQVVFAAYGFDPCPNDGTTIDGYLDPLGDREQDNAELEKVIDIFLVVLILGAALAAIYFLAIKKK